MADAIPSVLINLTEIEWAPVMDGVKAKNIWSDSETRRRVALTRFEPGATLPMHRHVGDEMLFVLEGAITDESSTVVAGNMGFRPNGCVHSVSSKNGATVLALITGGVEPAKAPGDAPRSQLFVLSDLPWVDALPGVRQKRIWDDAQNGRHVALARFEPGASLPKHRHAGDEILYMIEGSSADEFAEVPAGMMSYRPNGCTHSVRSRNGGTVLAFVRGGVEKA